MSQVLEIQDLVRWLERFAELIDDSVDHLTQLDSAIGDADHGVNMARGAAAIRAELAELSVAAPAEFFDAIGHVVLEETGGAAGPLYASLFLGAAKSCRTEEQLDIETLATALMAGVAELAARGRTELGDKTMYDAAQPAVTALAGAGSTVIGDAIDAARAGRDATEALQARKGRAAYLGPRSVGHVDPGAASVTLLFEALQVLERQGPT